MYNVASSNGKDVVPPFNVVITGSTKGKLARTLCARGYLPECANTLVAVGIGKALATNFVRSGDNVVICSRSGAAQPDALYRYK